MRNPGSGRVLCSCPRAGGSKSNNEGEVEGTGKREENVCVSKQLATENTREHNGGGKRAKGIGKRVLQMLNHEVQAA